MKTVYTIILILTILNIEAKAQELNRSVNADKVIAVSKNNPVRGNDNAVVVSISAVPVGEKNTIIQSTAQYHQSVSTGKETQMNTVAVSATVEKLNNQNNPSKRAVVEGQQVNKSGAQIIEVTNNAQKVN